MQSETEHLKTTECRPPECRISFETRVHVSPPTALPDTTLFRYLWLEDHHGEHAAEEGELAGREASDEPWEVRHVLQVEGLFPDSKQLLCQAAGCTTNSFKKCVSNPMVNHTSSGLDGTTRLKTTPPGKATPTPPSP